MKLRDHVLKTVDAHPLLYLTPTYEQSRLLVLHHIFLVCGNGYQWAWGLSPEQGGYPTKLNQVYDPDAEEWTIFPNYPYGQETFNKSWEEILHDGPITERKQSEEFWARHSLSQQKKVVDLKDEGPNFMAFNAQERFPYPFSERHWLFAEIDPKLIKPDWKEGALDVLHWALGCYQDTERYLRDRNKGNGGRTPGEGYRQNKKRFDSWATFLEAYEFPQGSVPEGDYEAMAVYHATKDQADRIKVLQETITTLIDSCPILTLPLSA